MNRLLEASFSKFPTRGQGLPSIEILSTLMSFDFYCSSGIPYRKKRFPLYVLLVYMINLIKPWMKSNDSRSPVMSRKIFIFIGT